MPTVVLDPGLLAYVESISRIELFAKVQQLVIWSKVAAIRPWVKIALPPSTRTALELNNLLPAHEAATKLLLATGLRGVYSPEDIIRPVYHLLERALPTVYCCVSDELHADFESDPVQPWHGGNPTVEELSQRALLMSLLEDQIHKRERLNLFASVVRSGTIKFAARLEVVEPGTIPDFGPEELPKGVVNTVQHVSSLDDVCAAVDPARLWADATTSLDIKTAIQLACRKRMIAEGNYSGFDSIPVFFVGADFLPSLKRWQADAEHRFATQTLESCAAAVLNLPTIEIKPFNKAQRVDLASPFRAHISKSGVALRLMMWQRPLKERCIEFANVGGKKEEEISYSDPSAAV